LIAGRVGVPLARERFGDEVMARIFACRVCRVELESIKLAGSRAMVVCVACEQIGFSDEVVHGAPLWDAEIGEIRRRRGKNRRVSLGLRASK
jgi:hypothetical protein